MSINSHAPHALQVLCAGGAWRLSLYQMQHLGLLIAGILLAWLRVVGIAVAMGCALAPAELAVVSPARVVVRCAGCGVVESMREAASDGADATGRYEVAVRMRDGSIRVVPDANPASWRIGERVTLIEGESGAGE